MRNKFKQENQENEEKVVMKDSEIEYLQDMNKELSRQLANTLEQYHSLEENMASEVNAKQSAQMQLSAMEGEFYRIRLELDGKTNNEDESIDNGKNNKNKDDEIQTLSDTIFALEEKVFQLRLEAKDKKMLNRVQALRLKMNNIDEKINKEEGKTLELNKKFKECTDLIRKLENELDEYKLNEAQAVNKLEIIMKEIENINEKEKDKNNVTKEKDLNNEEPECMRKLFVRNLSFGTTEQGLKAYLEEYGKVNECVIMREAKTQRSRGFGFVTFASSKMVDLVQSWRPHEVDNREIETKRAIPRGSNAKEEDKRQIDKIFIRGIKEDINEKDILEACNNFGKVSKIYIPKHQTTQKCKEYGFVSFEDYDSVDKLCLYKEIKIKGHILSVNKAMDKNNSAEKGSHEEAKKYQSSFNQNNVVRHPNHYQNNRFNNNRNLNQREGRGWQNFQRREHGNWGGHINQSNLCYYYMNGGCKFGDFCRKSHQTMVNSNQGYTAPGINHGNFLGIESKINQEVRRQLRSLINV